MMEHLKGAVEYWDKRISYLDTSHQKHLRVLLIAAKEQLEKHNEKAPQKRTH